jgi:hypothetical protein
VFVRIPNSTLRDASSFSEPSSFLTGRLDDKPLAVMNGVWIDKVHDSRPPKMVVLDMDSSVSPTHGDQEGTAYNLANFMRTLALPKEVDNWSLITLREKLVKIGAKVVSHGLCVTFQLAEVAVPRELFQKF